MYSPLKIHNPKKIHPIITLATILKNKLLFKSVLPSLPFAFEPNILNPIEIAPNTPVMLYILLPIIPTEANPSK